MCRKIRYDGESWKLFEFRGELNKALLSGALLSSVILQYITVTCEMGSCLDTGL